MSKRLPPSGGPCLEFDPAQGFGVGRGEELRLLGVAVAACVLRQVQHSNGLPQSWDPLTLVKAATKWEGRRLS